MLLLTSEQHKRLLNNGKFNNFRRERGEFEIDFKPVVKLFCPWGGATWLLSELDPNDPHIAFGLCDLGMGFPELGNVSLSELKALKGPFGLTIERDLHFVAAKSIGEYAEEARLHERIIA